MNDILKQIVEDKREHVENRKSEISISDLDSQAKQADPVRGFATALLNKKSQNEIGLIAEIKKASPSKGLIRKDFDPKALAKSYEMGGATCLSVLTDEKYFQGKDEYIAEAKSNSGLPVLRKDFMLDPYQVAESRAIGADCILLIMAALGDVHAKELEEAAIEYHMDVLVEVHDEEELERALKLETQLLGINNRNLKTLEINLSVTERLSEMVPDTHLLVCESGIYKHDDIKRMRHVGASTFLVGESLMKQEDVTQATKNLLAA